MPLDPHFLAVSVEARSLAQAVLDGDTEAVAALVDWVLEQQTDRRQTITRAYVEKLEDTLREVRRRVMRSKEAVSMMIDPESDGVQLDLVRGDAVLMWNHVNELYTAMHGCEQMAYTIGREGSW